MTSVFSYSLSQREHQEISAFLKKDPHYTLFQHPDFMKIYNPGKRICFFQLHCTEDLNAFCIIVEHYKKARIYFGPISKDKTTYTESVKAIVEHYKQMHFILLEIFPPNADLGSTLNIETTLFKILPAKSSWASPIINLQREHDVLLKSFSKNHQRAIQKAIKYGLRVKPIETIEEVECFACLYTEMYAVKRLTMPFANPSEVFRDLLCLIKKDPSVGLFLGIFEGKELFAAAFLGFHYNTMFYHFGATKKNTKIPMMHLLFNEAFKAARALGFTQFDLGGYDQTASSKSQTGRINDFKLGFGPAEISTIPLYNIVLNRAALWGYNRLHATYMIYRRIRNNLKFTL